MLSHHVIELDSPVIHVDELWADLLGVAVPDEFTGPPPAGAVAAAHEHAPEKMKIKPYDPRPGGAGCDPLDRRFGQGTSLAADGEKA